MNRHSWRACRGEVGFSFVELLVTIVIAAVIFAAMIPLFVQAQKVNASDNMRNVALQLCRERIEAIRALPYDLVDEDYLETHGPPLTEPGHVAGQFGTSWTVGAGTSTKDLTVHYSVALKPDGAVPGQEDHKSVQVWVTWEGAPLPAFTTHLQTDVSRQYFGPALIDLMSPEATASITETPTITAGGDARLIATVSPETLGQMSGTTPGKVVFSVTDINGSQVASGESDVELSPSYPAGISGQYQWIWDTSAVNTGYYTFTAYAVSSTSAAGKAITITYYVESSNLPAPTLVSAEPGDQSATLTWTPVANTDHYEIWRGTSAGGEAKIIDSYPATTLMDGPPTYAALTNGTTYYYYVVAVDADGTRSARSNELSVTPSAGADVTAPSDPSGLASPSQTTTSIGLTWTASSDDPPPDPPSGVALYEVSRSTDNVTWVLAGTVLGSPPVPPSASYLDTGPGGLGLTPNTTYYYKVRAFDGENNASGYSAVASFTTAAAVVVRHLTVANTSNGNKTMSVSVQNVSAGPYYQKYFDLAGNPYSTPPSITISNKASPNSKTWNVPAGQYIVVAKYSTTTKTLSPNLTVSDQTISFSF